MPEPRQREGAIMQAIELLVLEVRKSLQHRIANEVLLSKKLQESSCPLP
ncbi:MAG: hypothetical protein KME10_07685 [Plectolyngbya sp. WJT66-NPBG17]|jgi:hypothetical protein|nr:hypothetical protein [Plectolyngbya sp. WJT66-NPBG17]MBW4527753.1 hypothetical protein [Phormidium tanganyikae FI6-MK23]